MRLKGWSHEMFSSPTSVTWIPILVFWESLRMCYQRMCMETHTQFAIQGWDFQKRGTENRPTFCKFIKSHNTIRRKELGHKPFWGWVQRSSWKVETMPKYVCHWENQLRNSLPFKWSKIYFVLPILHFKNQVGHSNETFFFFKRISPLQNI